MSRVALLPGWLEPPEVDGVQVVTWDSGEPMPPRSVLDHVEFFVPPYMCPISDVAVAAQMPRLRVVQALMAGVDGMAEVVPADVTVLRAQQVHDTSTAELALGLIIAAQRGIDIAARDMVTGTWGHRRRRSLADSRVGIVGWGGVGRAIADRLAPFEVSITAFSRSGSAGSVPVDTFDEMLPDMDVVVLALPLTMRTRLFMDSTRLALMAEGALLVNVGRGGLIATDALVSETASGRIRAALDVTDPEPLPPDHPLWGCPGVLITPHIGGNSAAFVPRARAMVAGQLRRLAAGEFDRISPQL